MSEMNILNYQAKSEAARSVEDLVGKIDSAARQWDSYGAALTLSYKTAYEEHAKTLKHLEKRFRSESSGLFWFILSAFAAGMAGGVAGMLIAPILTKAGTYVAQGMAARTNRKFEEWKKVYMPFIEGKSVPAGDRLRVTRALDRQKKLEKAVNKVNEPTQTVVVEGTKEVGVKSVEKLELEKFFAPAPPKPEGVNFSPPETDPHKFDLVKRIEIGICASILKENVRRFQLLADAGRLPMKTGQEFRESNLAGEFLNDQPDSEQIAAAASEKAQRQAEVGMWIAWAATMNTEYFNWKMRLEGVEFIDEGRDYFFLEQLLRFDPVFDRLMYLGVGGLVGAPWTSKERPGMPTTPGLNGQVLSIPKLQQLGKQIQNPFLNRVDTISRQRRMTVEDFEAITGTKLA